ncbi:MAG TPA: hypothetical protein VFQ39_20020 [Longimicrobium sp.]|nr:hypothetical protein [Longimicrobium sp.]
MSRNNGTRGRLPRLRIGQRVEIPGASGNIPAEVIEDRGPLGVGGGQVVRLRTLDDLAEARREFELPVEFLIVVE